MKINAFSKTYEGRKVLDMPKMELTSGKIYAVIGANGSGKSTLAKCLAGIIRPDQKEQILFSDISVGYMPQKSYAFRMNVEKNILLGSKDLMRAKKLMEELQIEHLAKKSAAKLSGGETARMALGRVLMKSFDLLILDEPVSGVDQNGLEEFYQTVDELKRKNHMAILLVSHDLSVVERYADRVVLMQGTVVKQGVPELVFDSPEFEQVFYAKGGRA